MKNKLLDVATLTVTDAQLLAILLLMLLQTVTVLVPELEPYKFRVLPEIDAVTALGLELLEM